MQVAHNSRLMEKHSNNTINGIPDFLDSFNPKDENKVGHLVRKILENKYNYKKDKKLLDSMAMAFK